MLFRLAPDKYFTEVLGEAMDDGGVDPMADQHFRLLSQGQDVPPEQNPSKAHLATHDSQMQSPEFQELSPEIQTLVVEHVKAEVANSKQALGQSEEQPQEQPEGQPEPKEMQLESGEEKPQGLLGRLMGNMNERLKGGGEQQ